jgi:hypothetical protein
MPRYAPLVPGKLSALVVSFNRAGIIGTCLRALRFADEVIVVDKSSTDETPEIAARLADRVITVPWSPTVEETRAFAVAQCSHDWIVFVDDDECLSSEAVRFIQAEVAAPRADAYAFPRRHYILGVHDERAYYWPEHQICLFRRGAVEFNSTVHAGVVPRSDRMLVVAEDTGACIRHLSHQDVAQWLDKTNRYTSCADRARVEHAGDDLIGFAHARIDHWLERTRDAAPGGYPRAVALLRTTYDLIDRLKTWEEERGLDGPAEFARICAALDAGYAALPVTAPRAGRLTRGCPALLPPGADAAQAALRARIAELRAGHDASAADAARWAEEAAHQAKEVTHQAKEVAHQAEETAHQAKEAARWAKEAERLEADLSAAVQRLECTDQALVASQQRVEAIEASASWRAMAWPRRLAEHARRLARWR